MRDCCAAESARDVCPAFAPEVARLVCERDVLDDAGLLKIAQVLEMVAELLEEHRDQSLGLGAVTGNRNLQKNVILKS